MLSQKRKRTDDAGDASDSSSYSIVPAGSDDEIDISSALTGKKPRNAGKQRAIDDDAGSDDALSEMIRASIAKRNVKGGAEVVKKAKGKTRISKGEVGGGSFQSMGACSQCGRSSTLMSLRRSAPLAPPLADTAGLPHTDAHPAAGRPCSPRQSAARPSGHGADGIRKVPRIHDPSGATAQRPTFDDVWRTCPDLAACTRTGPADIKSRQGAGERVAGRRIGSRRRRKGHRGQQERTKSAMGLGRGWRESRRAV